MKVLFLLAAFLGAAAAFTPSKPMRTVAMRKAAVAPKMSLKSDMAKSIAVASTVAAPLVAGATEGTNEILGIDTLIIPLLGFPVLVAVNLLFNDWAQTQDNDEFFDGLGPPPK
uniref:PSII 6.1 kDa protein n=1 Tax=Rhizochromulina marina TaxID=1034831 RepID=A0A6U0YMB5_9STRA|mmetsp:Transcript_18048/g.52729  ORF Transcript_18048/g.52729 Transcript_18048/m.52729 type:complete len:113 (+) Transcript_18048:50-388(+)